MRARLCFLPRWRTSIRCNIHPIFFRQTEEQQLETLCHEIGHGFGLRHFFALISERSSALLFGKQYKFTIMNYGSLSRLTETDKSDKKIEKLAGSIGHNSPPSHR